MISLVPFAIFTSFIVFLISTIIFLILIKETFSTSYRLIETVNVVFTLFQKYFFKSHLYIILFFSIIFSFFVYISANLLFLYLFLSFLIACSLILFLTFMNIFFFSKILSRIQHFYSQFFNTGFMTHAFLSFLLVTMNLSCLLLVLFLNIYFLGNKSCIGFLFGFGLSSFILRISSAFFNVSTSLSEPTLKDVYNIQDQDQNNPSSHLKVSSVFISKSLGFNFDLLHSMLFSLIAAIFVALFYKSSFLHFLPDFSILYNAPIMITFLVLFSNICAFSIWIFQKRKAVQKKCYLPLYYSLLFSITLVSIFLFSCFQLLNLHFIAIFSYIFFPFFCGVLLSFFLTFFSYHQSSFSKKMIFKLLESSLLSTCFTLFQLERLRNKSWFFQLFLFLIFGYATYFVSGFLGLSFVALGYFSCAPSILFLSTFEAINNASLRYLNLIESSSIPTQHLLNSQKQINSTSGLSLSYASQAAILAVIGLFFSLFFYGSTSYMNDLSVDISFILGLSAALLFIALFRYFLLKQFSILCLVVISEVKRQFIELPLLIENKIKPDTFLLSAKLLKATFLSVIIPSFFLVFVPLLLYSINLKILYSYCFFLFFFVIQETYCMSIVGESISSVISMFNNGFYGGSQVSSFSHLNQHKLFNDGLKDVMLPALSILLKASILIAMLLTFLVN